MESINWIELLISILLASFGGIVNCLADTSSTKKESEFQKKYISSAIISMFVGIIAYSLASHFKVSFFLMVAGVSVAGFYGTKFIYLVTNLSFKHIRIIEKDKKDTNTPKGGTDVKK